MQASSVPSVPPFELEQLARTVLTHGRAELRARHDAGASGADIVQGFSLLMDRLITVLFGVVTQEYVNRPPRIRYRCAVMAQGGYGRRELSPCSDIDLVFLYPWKVTPYIEGVAQKILYSLWDTGLSVGHALRNPRTCVRLAERDLTVKTALLDARYVCGDITVFQEFKEAMRTEVLSRPSGRFLREKLNEAAERHQRFGDSVYLLQPHLKEGEGGLRDYHTAFWMAKIKFKIERLRDLVRLGVLTERELVELEVSRDFLWRVRNALHFNTGTYQNQLTFDHQESIAGDFGYHDSPSEQGVERFMRFYYLHAATVHRFSETVIARCMQRPASFARASGPSRTVRSGMTIRGGELHVTGRQVFRQAPANLIRVFAEAQRHGVGLSQLTKKCIRDERTLITDGMQRDPDAVAAFLDILRSRSRVYEAIREMHKEGILIHFIPEFANLLCRVQRDMHHIYTVDEHSLRGILELERLRAGEYARICPLLTEVMRETDGVDLLFLAMLFHDLGKGYGHGHSERGALLVREISGRLGLNSDDAQQLEFLVRNHLLMSHLAQHRDIHDDDLIQGFARDVGDVSTLRKLYLLTFADMQAVGPRFWNNWRDMLLGELYIRTLRALERGGSVEENPAARVARVQDRIRRATPANRDRVEAFLASMPSSYFLTTPEEMIPGHVLLVERLERAVAEGSAEVTTALRHFPEWDYSEFTVCTADRPGLFSMLAGVIAAADINVLSARIATSTNGTALDVFRLSHTQRREAAIEDTRWERVRRNVEAVLTGEVEVETLVDASRRPSPLSRPRKSSPRDRTAVVVDNAISRDHTVLDVHTSDRIGLLFVITRCLYRLGLEIRLAKITTTLEQVLDVFYVSERDGRKIEDAARLDEITRVLTERLLEDAATANSTQG